MKRCIWVAWVVTVVGCGDVAKLLDDIDAGTILDLVFPTSITLRLINNTEFRVEPEVYVSGVDLLTEGFILPGIAEEALTLGVNLQLLDDMDPGEVVSRTYDCDAFKAVMVKDAELQTGIGLSPEEDSNLLLEGKDFDCGDTVTIRYELSLRGFEVRISATPNVIE